MSDKKKTEPQPQREVRHYAIIPLMIASSMDRVISVLVKRGYTVGPLASSKKVYATQDGNCVTILALDLRKTIPDDGEESRNVILDDIKDVLNVTNTRYYMITVGELNGLFTWTVGNVTVAQDSAVNVATPTAKTSGNLN